MKTTKKTTKKTIKPAYTVDITKCVDAFDLLVAFGRAKQQAGLPITDRELDAIIEDSITPVVIKTEVVVCGDKCRKERKPWYKRFWNWLFGKKK